MSIEQADVEKIAALARIHIDGNEVAQVAQRINDILAMVDKMRTINTDNIEPLANPLEVCQRLRPDIVTETDQHTAFQAIAPRVDKGLYLVPKVIE